MGDGHENSKTGATFVLTRQLASGTRATLADGGGDLCYGGSIHVSAARSRPEMRSWKGRFHATPVGLTAHVQICCKQGACALCPTVPPCTGGVEPLIEGDKHIEMAADVQQGRTADVDDLQLPDGMRVPILTSDTGDKLLRQLQPWHDAMFDAKRTVVYHLYHLDEEMSDAASAITLDGKVIAIPVEPTPELPASAVDTKHS